MYLPTDLLPATLVVEVQQSVWCVCLGDNFQTEWPLMYIFGLVLHLNTKSAGQSLRSQVENNRSATARVAVAN